RCASAPLVPVHHLARSPRVLRYRRPVLSPTLALCCPHCKHALSLADIRGAAICPACAVPHGLPPAVADALALYERAIQQAVAALGSGAPAGSLALPAPTPATAPPAPTPAPVYAPSAPGPASRLLSAPVPTGSAGYPATHLSIGLAAPPPPAPPSAPAPGAS